MAGDQFKMNRVKYNYVDFGVFLKKEKKNLSLVILRKLTPIMGEDAQGLLAYKVS